MKYLPLMWRNLMRKKVRTLLTLLSIFVAFVLYGLLASLQAAFGVGVDLAGADRMIMLHKVSIIQQLPLKYKERIAAHPDVELVTHASWFGGVYQDPKNQFPQFPVDAESYLDMYPEFLLPEEQREAFLANRAGAVVGRATANKYGWKVGDRIPIQGTIYRRPDGNPWELTIEGIYDGADETADDTVLLFHYDYVDETLGRFGTVGWYVVKIKDPDRAAEIAESIDAMFANSPAETRTSTEKAFIQAFANQTGNIAKMVAFVVGVVFFTLLLVAGNTMAQSVRERIGELGVLKTLGFRDGQVMGLVLGESFLMALTGGLAGLFGIYVLTRVKDLGGSLFPALHMGERALAVGLGIVLLLGLVAGLVPALQARRLEIVDALRRV